MKRLILFIISLIIGIVTYNLVAGVGDIKIKPGKYIVLSGSNVSDIRSIFELEDEVNKTFFKLYLRLLAPKGNLHAGTFSIKKEISLNYFLLNKASKPDFEDLEIIIHDGYNVYDLDYYLYNKGISGSGELLLYNNNIPQELLDKYDFLNGKTLEGFLYPDTYRINPDSTLLDVLNLLLETFDNRIYSKYEGDNFYEDVIFASIVHRETFNPSEQNIVAGILKKRFREGIPLGADATVCYEYKLRQSECTQDFINKNIYIKSRYNTREDLGLPPTPISNFSKETFFATTKPKDSPYYFYLHDSNGVIHYGKTLNEHNNNKFLYIK